MPVSKKELEALAKQGYTPAQEALSSMPNGEETFCHSSKKMCAITHVCDKAAAAEKQHNAAMEKAKSTFNKTFGSLEEAETCEGEDE